MKISFNPSNSNKNILDLIKNNKDIIFDLKGHSIFARGVEFKGTDTNTWRDIKINNVSIGSHTLDLRNGSNTTLTNTNGVVTINSTWRPVVDNLTSDSTTSSLSAKQGKVLKALIDGKSNSGHTHDDRYLKLTGGTMAGNALITFADSGSWGTDKGPQGARGGLYWTGQSDYAKLYAEETVGDNLDLVIQFGDDNSNGLSIRNKANTQTSYISAGGVITTGTFKGNLDWSYITNKPASYTPSAHTHAWNSLTHSSTTENQAILTNGKANGWKLYTLNISRWDNAANNAHSHANKSVLDGITSALVNSWNTAYNFVSNITGTDTDKVINKWEEIVNFLAGITEDNKLNTLLNSKLSIQQLSAKDILTTKTNNALFWVDTKGNASTITTGPFTDHPYALLSVTNYNQNAENHKFFYRSRLAFSSAGDIKVASCHHEYKYQQDETWYNVLTSKNSGINGSTIKLNGTSITVYSSGTADGRYVKKSGDTMQGVLTIDTTNFGALTIKRNDDANGASIQFRGKSSVYGYIGLNNSTKDKQFLRWSSDTSRIYTILDTSSTYISNGKGVINGTTITQVDNATNSTNSTNARKLVNWYSARPTSLNAQFGDGSLRIFYATSSTTEGKPAEDSHILHLAWDNTGGYDAQLAVHAHSGKVSTRAQNAGPWQPWKTLAFTTDIPTSLKNPYSFNVFGVVYDGSAAKTVTTSNFISQVNEGTSTITDGTMLITSYASNSGFADTNAVNVPYKRKAIYLWKYIKAKTDSLYATKGHNHDGRYAISENYGGFKKSGRLPISGFYQSHESESGGNAPWSNWMHLINCQHNNTDNNYALQIAASFFDNNTFKIRVTNNNVNNSWRNIIHSGNISSQSVNYANSAGNADTVDGEHASAFTRIVGRHSIATNGTAPYRYIHLFRIANSDSYSTVDCEIDIRTRYHSAKIEIRISTGHYPYNNGGSSISIVKKVVSGRTCNLWVLPTVQTSNYNYYDVYYESGTWNSGSYGITLKGNNGILVFEHKGTKLDALPPNVSVVNNQWVMWNDIAGKPSSFTPAAHTHTVFKNNLMIKGTNGISDSASIHLGIGDSDTGFKWISDGVCQIYANNVAVGQWTSGGMNWFKNPTVNGNKVWNAGNDGSGSGLDADTLDGYHANGLLTALSNSNNGISITVGGTTKSISNINVNYAASAGNASTATKLQTPRTIWGQSFDGTGNVSGSLSEVGNIHFKVDNSYDIGSDAAASRYIYTHWLGARSGRKLELGANNSGFGQGLCIDTNLNVGIGTNSPTQKLDVIGNIRATGQLYLPTNGNYNAILMGDGCWMGDCNINNVIGLSGRGNANSGGIKFGKGGMYIGYNGSSHYSSGTSLWTNFNADTVDGEHAANFSYTHQSSFDFRKSKSGRIVTFDQLGTDYGGINGFASTRNDYLTSVIFNEHRSSNWYVGYMEGDMYTGETNGLEAVHKLAFADGDENYPIFLGYLRLYNGYDGTIGSYFPCLGYLVPFTYTRGGAYCLINIPNTSFQTFHIKAAIASVHYSGTGMGDQVGNHRGEGAWWLYCDAVGSNAVQVKGFHPANSNNDSWWGGNPLYVGNGAAKIITVCLFGYVKFR